MTLKEIRSKSGLSQRQFAEKYHIPLQTIKQWEAGTNSTSHRKPPEYVELMLKRIVDDDFKKQCVCVAPALECDPLIDAAQYSYGNANHWFRYLRKEFEGENCKISKSRLEKLLACDALSMFQKVSLKQAVKRGTLTNKHVISLNRRAETPMVDALRKKYEETWLKNSVASMNESPPEEICDKLYDFSNLTVLMPPLDYIAGMKLQSARRQDIEDVAAVIRKNNIIDPEELSKKLQKYGMDDIDVSLLLESFGQAYGMEWLENYYINHQDKLLQH